MLSFWLKNVEAWQLCPLHALSSCSGDSGSNPVAGALLFLLHKGPSTGKNEVGWIGTHLCRLSLHHEGLFCNILPFLVASIMLIAHAQRGLVVCFLLIWSTVCGLKSSLSADLCCFGQSEHFQVLYHPLQTLQNWTLGPCMLSNQNKRPPNLNQRPLYFIKRQSDQAIIIVAICKTWKVC